MKPDNDYIKRYLLNQLNEEEKIDFQFQLLHNKTLQDELALMRHLQKTLNAQQLKANRSKHQKKWWLLGLVVLLLGSLVFWYLQADSTQHSTQDKSSIIENTKQVSTPSNNTISDSIETTATTKKIIENKQSPKESSAANKTKPTPKTKIKTTPPTKKISPPPIAGAFEINPDLENFIDNNLRGDSFEFSITTPTQNAIFKTAEQAFKLKIKGQMFSEESVEDYAFRCLIFSNKVADYKAFKSLAAMPLTFTNVDNKINFEATQNIQLPAGLYYYLIEDEHSGEIFLVGKFELR